MRRVLIVFGTRPEAIKMAPVVRRLRAEGCFNVRVCVTGQHREMLDQVLNLFGIEPHYDLNVMRARQTLTGVTISVMSGLDKVLQGWAPDAVLVHGDTTTTMAASLCAFHRRIPVGHVDAGLRTGDLASPWPEEMNRVVTDCVSSWFFAPTETAKRNLVRCGTAAARIFVTGNPAIDALLAAAEEIHANRIIKRRLDEQFSYLCRSRPMVLVTGHQRENFSPKFRALCEALRTVALRRPDVQIIYPVHLNARVQGPVRDILSGLDNVALIEPQDYVSFTYLMTRCHLMLTDSAGVQEEAPSLGKPVLVARDTTERPEAIEAGTAVLVGTDTGRIIAEVESLLQDGEKYARMVKARNPYGDGRAAERIANALCAWAQVEEVHAATTLTQAAAAMAA